jgi:iron(III) transport system ATP-binding protein
MTQPHLQLDRIHVAYDTPSGPQAVVTGLSLTLAKGQIGCLLGPSGCGKTTVLRAIGGFEPLSGGAITLHGITVSDARQSIPPEKRKVGVVFQDYALFPHLSVFDNIGFGLRKLPRDVRRARVNELLELVGLPQAGSKYPHELSGGQQQRVALARALAPAPELLLLDEPFSNLDVDLRERLATEVRDILKQAGATALLVTHDQFEAFAIADAIGVMSQGTIVQWDDPYHLYHRPHTRFVADFIGRGVFVPGQPVTSADGGGHVDIELGRLPLPTVTQADPSIAPNGDKAAIDVLLRADDVLHDDDSPLKAQVVRKAFRGADFLYTLRMPSGREVLAYVPSHHNHAIGEQIGIRLVADHVVTFARDASDSSPAR